MGQAEKRTENRSESRTRALVRARLRGSGFDRDATILDLSAQGLLLSAAMPPKPAHKVTVMANGYTVSGQVRWVNERQFGISLDSPIVVEDVVDARILAPKPARAASPGLPENFGARPVAASSNLTFGDHFKTPWARYAMIVVCGIIGTILLRVTVDSATAGLEQEAALEQAAASQIAEQEAKAAQAEARRVAAESAATEARPE